LPPHESSSYSYYYYGWGSCSVANVFSHRADSTLAGTPLLHTGCRFRFLQLMLRLLLLLLLLFLLLLRLLLLLLLPDIAKCSFLQFLFGFLDKLIDFLMVHLILLLLPLTRRGWRRYLLPLLLNCLLYVLLPMLSFVVLLLLLLVIPGLLELVLDQIEKRILFLMLSVIQMNPSLFVSAQTSCSP
jgi:hypothetical protein